MNAMLPIKIIQHTHLNLLHICWCCGKPQGPALVVTESGLVAVAFDAPLHPVQAAQAPASPP